MLFGRGCREIYFVDDVGGFISSQIIVLFFGDFGDDFLDDF